MIDSKKPYFKADDGKIYQIGKKSATIKDLIIDGAPREIISEFSISKKYLIYEEIGLRSLISIVNEQNFPSGVCLAWKKWLCENGYIKEVKKEDEIKVGDFVKVKDMYFHCHPPHSLSELIRTEDYGIVKEKTEENIPYTCKVEFLAHPSLSFYYRCKDLEKLNSDLFEKVVLFRMDEKGCIVPDHCVYRKRK
jgi:hypothetical protein